MRPTESPAGNPTADGGCLDLTEMLERIGRDALEAPCVPMGPLRRVARVVVWRPAAAVEPGDVLLAVGMPPTSPRLAEVLEAAAEADAATVVVAGFADRERVQAEVDRTGVPALIVPTTMRWDELHRRLVAVAGVPAARRADPTDGPARSLLADDESIPRPRGRTGDRDGLTSATVVGLRTWQPWRPDSVEAVALCEEFDRTAGVSGCAAVSDRGHVHAAIPRCAPAGDPVRQVGQVVDFAAERLRLDLVVVIDEPRSASLQRPAHRRNEVDGALTVLAAAGKPRVGSLRELRTPIVLARLQALARSHPELLTGRLPELRALDEARGSNYLPTLIALFDAAGDLNAAAAAMYVHPNTIRYRLRRIRELSGLDLSDPLERLVVELQVRLLAASNGNGPEVRQLRGRASRAG